MKKMFAGDSMFIGIALPHSPDQGVKGFDGKGV
jgi:hypothetical protein